MKDDTSKRVKNIGLKMSRKAIAVIQLKGRVGLYQRDWEVEKEGFTLS